MEAGTFESDPFTAPESGTIQWRAQLVPGLSFDDAVATLCGGVATVVTVAETTSAPTGTPSVTPTPSATTTTPTPPAEADLVPAGQGGFTAPKKAKAGSTITLTFAGNRAGQQVETFVFSTPTTLGVRTVSAAQTITVTLPATIAVGQHRLLVRAADGSVIGWQPIEVVAAGTSLAATGADLTAPIGAALVLVLAGATLVVVRRRQHA
jgi:hypothetical protein